MKHLLGFSLMFFIALTKPAFSQTVFGTHHATQLKVYEYYNHTGEEEWIKLFSITNHNADKGFWGKGGVAGTLYFVDYQGEGGSFVNFSFPQGINAKQKPVLTLSGNSADDFSWHAFLGKPQDGLEYYDIYIKTPVHHVGFTFLVRGSDAEFFFTKATAPVGTPVWSSLTNQESISYFKGNGNIGLGTLDPKEKLSVNGNIRAKEIKVETLNWPDYVFSNTHKKPSLAELETYIKINKHLPEIPSAKQAESEGVSLGEMNKKLLQKVEELTLYLIEQGKDLKLQKEKIQEQTNLILNQQKKIAEIEAKLK